ncbi:hypothetical protein HMP09_2352 [Sphingomonas sp. HMP9]|uniref:hypothetical protein n=1 Tax=Sphingomonas sp. HMP9 TaxID=1517554 RepID=UPI0015965F2F|nr:hypothetical protein [Sphingomonas sp. HMP9]BCA63118.1 hypothetical protein HMP09_2352 [Sphingomonas sp. HMP9]
MNNDREVLRDSLIRLVSMDVSEKEEDGLIGQINKISPDPNWSDYIYQTDAFVSADGAINIDDVLDKIFAYRPIRL